MKLGKNIHGTLSRIHAAQSAASAGFIVRALRKDGTVSKVAPTALDYARTLEDAIRIRDTRNAIPGNSRWVVTTDGGEIVS